MSLRRFAGVTSLAALVLALPAGAAITPEQAWQVWRGLAEGSGYTVTTEAEERSGDRLVLRGVTMGLDTDSSSIRAPLGEVVLRDRGDGTVEVTVADSFDITAAIREPDTDPVEMRLTVAQQGYVTIVSGTPEAPVYDIAAELLEVTQEMPVVNGTPMPMEMMIALGGISGRMGFTAGAPLIDITYTMDAQELEMAVAATDPETGADMEMSFTAEGLASNFTGRLPASVAPGADLADLLRQGLRGNGGYSTGPAEFTLAMHENGVETTANGAMTGTELALRLDEANIDYSVAASGLELELQGPQIPFPDFHVSVGEYRLGLGIPLLATPEPTDFGLVLRLVDLVLPESVWGMLDPGARLPREPATLVLDTLGKARLFRDLVAPPTDPSEAPGEVHAMTVRQMQLKAAGAELSGTGDFTFDNADMQTFPGMPRPAGKADMRLTGGNALLDNLVALGLVPQDQVMGLRMMLALFTRPGEGPDTLDSTIEITPEGQILANGQRIQ